MTKQWLMSLPWPDLDNAVRNWGVSHLVGQILLNRGLSPHESADSFLAPQLKNLHSPLLLPGASTAAALITEAVRSNARIVLYGDYDVDGIMGVAILWHVIQRLGGNASFYVPHRVEEGYGLNADAVNKLLQEGAEFLVSVDCGVTASEIAEQVRAAGRKLVITDHHTMQRDLPRADAVVHPAIGDGYPNRDLCGAGVAFKLAWALAQRLNGGDRASAELRSLLLELLPLAALGTIADAVPLTGENRIIAKHGLETLAQCRLPGLQALMESAGLTGERINGSDVGFKLAPRINAAGRMGHARLAVELFTRADEARAREIAQYLEEQNRARQSVERRMAQQAFAMIEQEGLASDSRRAIVLASPDWHAGVIGVVAARVVDRYHRPAILVAVDGAEGQGSGRSLASFDLAAALAECEGHLVSFGGHPMAAGLRISIDRIGSFTEAFLRTANQKLTGADLIPKLRLDAEVPLAELTLPTAQTLARLGPFGPSNPKPRLATSWVELAAEPRSVGRNQDHLQAVFRQNGSVMKGIGFGLAPMIEDLKQHRRCRVAFEPIINEYLGRRSVEMQIVDIKFPNEP